MRFLLEIEFVSADQALNMGMIGDVQPAEQFSEAFLTYCSKIAGWHRWLPPKPRCRSQKLDFLKISKT